MVIAMGYLANSTFIAVLFHSDREKQTQLSFAIILTRNTQIELVWITQQGNSTLVSDLARISVTILRDGNLSPLPSHQCCSAFGVSGALDETTPCPWRTT